MNGKLIVSEGGRERVHELLDETTVVGRAAQADLRVKDPKAAALHCEIRRTPQGFRVVDLETRDGTLVNGRHVNSHLLKQGDVVKVGDVEIAYLGDSGVEERAKRPSQVLAEAPRDEAGAPKRFYRHESKPRGGAETATKALIAAAVLIMAVVAGRMMYKAATDKNKVKFVEAQEILRNPDSEEKLLKVLRLLTEIEPDAVDPRDMGRLRQDAKERLEAFKNTRLAAEEYAAWTALLARYRTRPEEAAEILVEADAFLAKYPASDKAEEIRRMQRRLRLGGDPEQEWERLVKQINVALGAQKFAEAYALLAQFEAKTEMRREIGARVDAGRRAVDEKFGAYVAGRFQAAQAAAARGETEIARLIYSDVAAIGAEPHAETARRALAALK